VAAHAYVAARAWEGAAGAAPPRMRPSPEQEAVLRALRELEADSGSAAHLLAAAGGGGAEAVRISCLFDNIDHIANIDNIEIILR
jgi:hypothetical protein